MAIPLAHEAQEQQTCSQYGNGHPKMDIGEHATQPRCWFWIFSLLHVESDAIESDTLNQCKKQKSSASVWIFDLLCHETKNPN